MYSEGAVQGQHPYPLVKTGLSFTARASYRVAAILYRTAGRCKSSFFDDDVWLVHPGGVQSYR